MATAIIGLGSNLGDRAATLQEAVRQLHTLGRITAVSGLYETEPVGFREQPPFLNAVVGLETTRHPNDIMRELLAIERDLGRERTFRNAPRTLDLDLLLLGDTVLDTPLLTLPHPRLHERAFVLAPLAEIAAGAMHPVFRQTVSDMLAALPDWEGVDLWAMSGWESEPCVESTT
ncbi:MAG: 2-amino-4-hydroxy-6-hydroxymethyldihydropteridine diphosphokinase [Chloroflexota bacterium]|nr:2-amino-4-hydroxy-6-hydroxymethyldihydropteridine diphosphokinase [Chloroflexota bacterium]